MKCDDMPQRLVTLLYGELEPEEEKQIKAHLKACPACRQVYEELRGTSRVLQKWEDVAPKMNLVFVQEPVSRWKTWKEKYRQLDWGRRLALGVPVLAVLLFISLTVLNFRARYEGGEWNVAFSLIPQREQGYSEEQLAEALNQSQQETLVLLSRMIEEGEYRQRREFTLMLAQFAQDLEKQRRQDLWVMGQGLEGLQRATEGQFSQTNDVLSDLIRLTSYKVERK